MSHSGIVLCRPSTSAVLKLWVATQSGVTGTCCWGCELGTKNIGSPKTFPHYKGLWYEKVWEPLFYIMGHVWGTWLRSTVHRLSSQIWVKILRIACDTLIKMYNWVHLIAHLVRGHCLVLVKCCYLEIMHLAKHPEWWNNFKYFMIFAYLKL